MNLQIRIWISNVVLFVVPILIAIILFLLYFTGLRILLMPVTICVLSRNNSLKVSVELLKQLPFMG